jgi:hypothetical protein
MGPCLFLVDHLFCLSHYKTRWTMSVDYVSLKIMSTWDLNLHGHSDIFLSPWCKPKSYMDKFNNQSTLLHGLRTSSTTNQHSYMALGWLHGPWCKQPSYGDTYRILSS